MKAIQIKELGSVEKLQICELEKPIIKSDNQILIKNEYIGINFIDIYHRTGLYKLDIPFILGREGSGTIEKVGKDVKDFKKGDKVVYFYPGSYCEFIVMDESKAYKLNQNIDLDVAAAAFLQGLSALTITEKMTSIKEGDWVLIHACVGGVGSILVQICKFLKAKTIGTTSSKEKMKFALEEIGVDHVINYLEQDVVKEVNDITNNKGVSAVFDGVGSSTLDVSLKCCSLFADFVSYGNAGGKIENFDILRLSQKNIKISRPTLGNFILERKDFIFYSDKLFKLIQDGHLKIHIFKKYKFEEVKQAHMDLESRKSIGKLILEI